MVIRLNVKKETFRSNLLKMGYSYKIKQYEDFIATIKRIVFSDIKSAFLNETMEETLSKIFNINSKNISLDILSKKEDIQLIDAGYLTSLIEESRLDLFFEENKEVVFNKDVQKEAYKKTLLNEFYKDNNQSRTLARITNHFKISSYTENKLLRCIGMNGITLTESEKEEEKENLEMNISRVLCSDGEDKRYEEILEILNFSEFNYNKYTSDLNDILLDCISEKLLENVSILKEKVSNMNISINEYIKIDRNMSFNNINYDLRFDLEKLIYSIKGNKTIEIKKLVYMDILRIKEDKANIENHYDGLKMDKNNEEKIKRFNKMIQMYEKFEKKITEIKDPFKIIEIYSQVFKGYTFMISSSAKLFKYINENKEELKSITNEGILDENIELYYGGKDFRITFKELKEYVDNRMN